MTAFAKLTYLDLKMFWRDPAASFFTLGLPLLLLLFFVGGNEPRESLAGLGVADFMVSGYIGLILATSGLMGLSQKLAFDRENGILRRMRTTPISPAKIMAAYVKEHDAYALTMPPNEGFHRLIYIIPVAILVLGTIFLLSLGRRWTRAARDAATPGPEPGDSDYDRSREQVEPLGQSLQQGRRRQQHGARCGQFDR